jgi:16S rRNA (adenine1518-N6/adenine1519-N6)-dimethyltransferase
MNRFANLDAAALLKKHGLRPRRRLGQNFLENPLALEQITTAALIERTDAVLEIGCGLGSLTRHLARAAARVVAVELDAKLAAIASETLSGLRNVHLVCADILCVSPEQLGMPPRYIAAANIPYYVTSAILRHLLESAPKPRRMVLTVQLEVARRVCAQPPDMSLLAVSVQVYGRAEQVAHIPAEAFYPVPKVDSAVVRIECFDEPVVSGSVLPIFFKVLRAGFGQRRKTLRNALAAGLKIPSSASKDLLRQAEIDPQRRAETLSVAEWARLGEVALPIAA